MSFTVKKLVAKATCLGCGKEEIECFSVDSERHGLKDAMLCPADFRRQVKIATAVVSAQSSSSSARAEE